ncbi:MAG TPA: hypothetical protein VMW68_11325 [Methyloceanibacter sp.]|nr:hypothetical protein [Methyloceanibacter sp.]
MFLLGRIRYTRGMLAHTAAILANANCQRSLEGVLRALRGLSLDEFGQLMFSLPDQRFPGISRHLPRMATPEMQMKWTGASGDMLLGQTLARKPTRWTPANAIATNAALTHGETLQARRDPR